MNEMKFSVLVVDDEYHICENICSKIKMMNMKEIGEVKTCYSGEEALEYWKRNPITYRLSTGGRFFVV